jgi:hypothetical protein
VTEVAQSLLARFHQLSADAGSPVAGIDVDRIELAVSDGDEANHLARDLRDDGRKPTPVLGPLGERDRRELLFAEQVCVGALPGGDLDAGDGLTVLRRTRADHHAPEPTLQA